jgi:hypothetical protein
MQKRELTQLTEVSELSWLALVSADRTIAQPATAPLHFSARLWEAEGPCAWPTAMQNVVLRQLTELR